jgi:hypothetical protein
MRTSYRINKRLFSFTYQKKKKGVKQIGLKQLIPFTKFHSIQQSTSQYYTAHTRRNIKSDTGNIFSLESPRGIWIIIFGVREMSLNHHELAAYACSLAKKMPTNELKQWH